MTRSVPLTDDRALAIMEELCRMTGQIEGDGPDGRFVRFLYQSRSAFGGLVSAYTERTQHVIDSHPRKNIIAQFLPVVMGGDIGFPAQCLGIPGCKFLTRWLDSEVGTDSNREYSFAIRKLPYVAARFQGRARLIRIVERMQEDCIEANATAYDMLAILRSCRRRLPKKCTVCILHSWLCPKYDRKRPVDAPRSYMVFELDGPNVDVRDTSENDFVGGPTIFLNYTATTGNLLA